MILRNSKTKISIVKSEKTRAKTHEAKTNIMQITYEENKNSIKQNRPNSSLKKLQENGLLLTFPSTNIHL